jgi:hypothetical protein
LAAKKHTNYSNTNPPYLSESAAHLIKNSGVQHLLIDLPSVDREEDEGKLLAHKAFWNVKDNRIDSIDSNLPNEVMDVIRYEFNNTTKSNWDILPDDEKNRQVLWLENEYMSKKSSRENELVEESRDYGLADPMIGEVADVAPRRARIVPIGLARFDDIPTQAG